MKEQDDPQPGKTPEEHFEDQKALTAEYASKIIAAQLAAKSVKSYKAGMEELAKENSGEAVSKKELNEMVKDMLSDENINNLAADIRERDDFKRMMNNAKDWKILNFIRDEAFTRDGKGLIDSLSKAQKAIMTESREKMRIEAQAEKAIDDPKLGGPQI